MLTYSVAVLRSDYPTFSSPTSNPREYIAVSFDFRLNFAMSVAIDKALNVASGTLARSGIALRHCVVGVVGSANWAYDDGSGGLRPSTRPRHRHSMDAISMEGKKRSAVRCYGS